MKIYFLRSYTIYLELVPPPHSKVVLELALIHVHPRGHLFFIKMNSNEPRALRGTLHAFQKEGLRFLLQHWKDKCNCILADEMGLGKTIQVSGGSYWSFEVFSSFEVGKKNE